MFTSDSNQTAEAQPANIEQVFFDYYQKQSRTAPSHQRLLSGSKLSGDQRFQQFFYWISQHLPLERPRENGRWVDFGSGLGRYCEELYRRGHQVTGVDYMQSFVDECNERSPDPSKIRYLQGSYQNINELFSEPCDQLISVGVFQNLDHPRNAITALAQLIKPGGLVAIETVNRHSFFQKFKNFSKLSKKTDAIRTYSPQMLSDLWANQGFCEKAIIPIFILPSKVAFMMNLLVFLARMPLFRRMLLSSVAHGFLYVGEHIPEPREQIV